MPISSGAVIFLWIAGVFFWIYFTIFLTSPQGFFKVLLLLPYPKKSDRKENTMNCDENTSEGTLYIPVLMRIA